MVWLGRARPSGPLPAGWADNLGVQFYEAATRAAITTIRLPLPYCREWHAHSADDGHRVSHCYVDTSP